VWCVLLTISLLVACFSSCSLIFRFQESLAANRRIHPLLRMRLSRRSLLFLSLGWVCPPVNHPLGGQLLVLSLQCPPHPLTQCPLFSFSLLLVSTVVNSKCCFLRDFFSLCPLQSTGDSFLTIITELQEGDENVGGE